MGKVERWIWGILIGGLVLGLVILIGSVPRTRAQGVSSMKRELDQTYRLAYFEKDVISATMIRFPEKEHGTNTVIGWPADSESIRTTASGSGNAIRWVQLVQLDGTARVPWIIYSPAFPAGADTIWTHQRGGRAPIVGGFVIDSLACLGNNNADTTVGHPDIQVWVSD
jgi:hypothetical protein